MKFAQALSVMLISVGGGVPMAAAGPGAVPETIVIPAGDFIAGSDQGERDACFRGGNGDDEDDQHLASPVVVITPESDRGHRHSLQHHLGAQKHDDHVPANDETDQADNETYAFPDRNTC